MKKKMNSYLSCYICEFKCQIINGSTGLCDVVRNKNNSLVITNYGLISDMDIQNIEKSYILHYKPNSKVLSLGSYSCNFRCP